VNTHFNNVKNTHTDSGSDMHINSSTGHIWALVLAAGEGSRLRSLTTTPGGLAIPKQFCSLHGGASLLQEALQRAAAVTSTDRTCAVVAAQHRRWWEAPLYHLPQHNVIVQPENRGTAHGILLPLLHILQRDPEATVLLLPADHHVRDEAVLAQSLRRATTLASKDPQSIFLLGIEPDQPDTELGYIVPGEEQGTASRVNQFVEKPPLKMARALLDRGALWNVFIVAAKASALLALYQSRYADTVMAMRAVVDADRHATLDAISASDLYQRLSSADFSRDVLEGQEAVLRVLAVPYCGWSDLGTPQRVAETLQHLPLDLHKQTSHARSGSYLSLAAQHMRQQFNSGIAMHGALS